MFRLIAPLQHRSLLFSRLYSTKASNSPPPNINTPKDWKIIETSPGGIDRDFFNRKTGVHTTYTPKGMSAAEILAIPDAQNYWSTIEEVEEYIKKMEAEKAKNGGKDWGDYK